MHFVSYGQHTTSIGNKARQVTALGKHDKKAKLSISLSLLLPYKESLLLHIQQANYVRRSRRVSHVDVTMIMTRKMA